MEHVIWGEVEFLQREIEHLSPWLVCLSIVTRDEMFDGKVVKCYRRFDISPIDIRDDTYWHRKRFEERSCVREDRRSNPVGELQLDQHLRVVSGLEVLHRLNKRLQRQGTLGQKATRTRTIA